MSAVYEFQHFMYSAYWHKKLHELHSLHFSSVNFTLLSAHEQQAAWPTNEVLVAVDLNNSMLVTEWREEQRPSPCNCWCLIVLSLPLKTAPNIIS